MSEGAPAFNLLREAQRQKDHRIEKHGLFVAALHTEV